MQKAKLSWLFIVNVFLLITAVISLARPSVVQSALAGHVVISEIQAAGAASGDDFIELYNPTNSDVNLGDMVLVKRTSSGTTDTSIVAFTNTDVIPTHGYFLWCNTALDVALACDKNSADTVSNDNSFALRNGDVDTGAIVDALTFGAPANPLGEGTSLTVPAANGSVERKANSASTQGSMLAGDATGGNGEDTDNNSADFVLRDLSQPQNATSSAETPTASPEPSASASESASPSASPSEEPSASPSPSPSASPSEEPSPSPSPSASPSVEPSPSLEPSPSPSESPSPSPSPSPSASPSVAPSPSASPSPSITPSPSQAPLPTATPKPKKQLVCKFEPKTIRFGFWEFTFHSFSCSWRTI